MTVSTKTTPKDFTNRFLSKVISVEMLFGIITATTVIALVYADVSQNKEDIGTILQNIEKNSLERKFEVNQLRAEMGEIKGRVNSLNVSNASIQTDVDNIEKDVDRIVELLLEKNSK